ADARHGTGGRDEDTPRQAALHHRARLCHWSHHDVRRQAGECGKTCRGRGSRPFYPGRTDRRPRGVTESIRAIRGMNDILPDEAPYWATLHELAGQVFLGYGYREIRMPIAEKTPLF